MSSLGTKPPDALGSNLLSVALIGPADLRRRSIVSALANLHGSVTREYPYYPEMDDMPRLLESDYDVIIVELDSNPEYALELVENICGRSPVTVMVYSDQVSPDMLVRCMRAGAREFLSSPITASSIGEAMVRAAVRRPAARSTPKPTGKLFVFSGAKGGSGVTTIASNFAVSLARDSGQSTALVDLNLPLGNAALDLGLTPEYSTVNALANFEKLDANYIASLLCKHSSGLSVLAAPDKFSSAEISSEAVEKLLQVMRQEFDNVVVDAGSRFDGVTRPLFEPGAEIYLVLQVSITELRNANRLISQWFSGREIKPSIILNRFTPRALSIDEASITKALTMPATWKVPGDYPAARTAQNTATPIVFEDSAISRVIRQMAKAASGETEVQEKKKKFSLFK